MCTSGCTIVSWMDKNQRFMEILVFTWHASLQMLRLKKFKQKWALKQTVRLSRIALFCQILQHRTDGIMGQFHAVNALSTH